MKRTASTLWAEAAKQLKKLLNEETYGRWIGTIQTADLHDDRLHLTVPNNFYQQWLEDNYLDLIQETVTTVAGRPIRVVFSIDPSRAETSDRPARRHSKAAPGLVSRPAPALNPKYTFDSFVVGSSNNFAHAACTAVARAPGKAYNPLFLYGGVGLGKTHLMQAIGQEILSRRKRARVSYVSCETFTNEYIDAIRNGTFAKFRRKYRSVDALLIDDIHFLRDKERLQEEFFHTFNALFDAHRQIVLSSDRPATEIAGLESRLISRFEWGLVTEILPPDLETRVAILRKKAVGADLVLPDDVILFIAERIVSNIRRLEGALIRVISYCSLTGAPPSVATAEHVLRDLLQEEARRVITIDEIQRKVAEHFDIRLADMSSRRRPRDIAFPRQVAMYLSRELTRSSLPEIGQAFGGRDHGTVIYACKVVSARIQQDENTRHTLSLLRRELERMR